MSILLNDKTNNREVLLAGSSPVDILLDPTSKNAIANKTVYNALAEKVEKTVSDLINYYVKSDVYNKSEVRELIGAVNTLTIEVVNSLPASDISTTTIYFLKQSGTNAYDEYVYVDNAWVKIGDTNIDLTQYETVAAFNTAIANYYTQAQVDTLLDSYYTKSEVNTELAGKQDTLTFDTTPTANSTNPVTSGGVKTALDAKQNALTFDSTPTAGSSNPVTSAGIKTAFGNTYQHGDATDTTIADDDKIPFIDTDAGVSKKITFTRFINKVKSLFVPKRTNEYTYNGLGGTGANMSSGYFRIKFPSSGRYDMKNYLFHYKHQHGSGYHGIISVEAYTNETDHVIASLTGYAMGNIPNTVKLYYSPGYIYIGPFGGSYANISLLSCMIHDSARNFDATNTVIDVVANLPSGYTAGTMKYITAS